MDTYEQTTKTPMTPGSEIEMFLKGPIPNRIPLPPQNFQSVIPTSVTVTNDVEDNSDSKRASERLKKQDKINYTENQQYENKIAHQNYVASAAIGKKKQNGRGVFNWISHKRYIK